MLGVILRLLAAGDGDRGAGDSLKNLTTRWLVFGIAGIIFASGIAFDDEGDFNATTGGAITVAVGTLAPGASVTVTFQVTID